VWDSAAMRPSSQITLGTLVTAIFCSPEFRGSTQMRELNRDIPHTPE